ncbi:MAG: hypothetical protein NC420_08435 [Eubacterium sp.]|nr:hypothetical protein [Eubacterium sp.]MCM1216043.1 hypothetical protein [Lachnospiraceae bacterium]MCM1239848.1 hypothetical protein [Lachnospiraceae bacterium]
MFGNLGFSYIGLLFLLMLFIPNIMIMYEAWWVCYFRSKRNLSDFYSSFLAIGHIGIHIQHKKRIDIEN